jgi:hypothetical protein
MRRSAEAMVHVHPLLSRPIQPGIPDSKRHRVKSFLCAAHRARKPPAAQQLQPEAGLTAIATFDQMNRMTKK